MKLIRNGIPVIMGHSNYTWYFRGRGSGQSHQMTHGGGWGSEIGQKSVTYYLNGPLAGNAYTETKLTPLPTPPHPFSIYFNRIKSQLALTQCPPPNWITDSRISCLLLSDTTALIINVKSTFKTFVNWIILLL